MLSARPGWTASTRSLRPAGSTRSVCPSGENRALPQMASSGSGGTRGTVRPGHQGLLLVLGLAPEDRVSPPRRPGPCRSRRGCATRGASRRPREG